MADNPYTVWAVVPHCTDNILSQLEQKKATAAMSRLITSFITTSSSGPVIMFSRNACALSSGHKYMSGTEALVPRQNAL